MIRNITGGYGIQVSGSAYSAPYIDSTRTSAGMVRYNNGNIEVYDGGSWLTMQSSYPTIELDSETREILRLSTAGLPEFYKTQLMEGNVDA